MRELVQRLLGVTGYRLTRRIPRDFTADDEALFRRVEAYTLTSPERIYSCTRAVEYVVRRQIPGAIVECGVWKGGTMMAVALTLLRLGDMRDLYLFDTFEGMVPPSAVDVDFRGIDAASQLARGKRPMKDRIWAYAPEEEVRQALLRTGYDPARMHFVRGRVEETLPGQAPEAISLLRLDTDWYESTRHELKHLYPRLTKGGVIIVDDYGHWQGARRATDEYLADHDIGLLLNRIDYTARIGIKT